jgi:Domain of unknown function (DUF4145)
MIGVVNPTITALLGDLPFQPPDPLEDNEVPCVPTEHSWEPLWVSLVGGQSHAMKVQPPAPLVASTVSLDYMYCANAECNQLVIRVHENLDFPLHAVSDPSMLTETWLARPRTTARSLDLGVPEPFRSDYREAAAILDSSPRMSAVLSRRILADLMETYGHHSQFKLSERIDKFIADKANPSGLRDNLHHFREIADFGAHTQKDDQTEIINVGREEAEWTLDLLDRLFDHFIVTPERDRRMRATMDERIKQAGRKPIPPLLEDSATEKES